MFHLGGSRDDELTSLAIGQNNEIIVGGGTRSGDFPTTVKAYNTIHSYGPDSITYDIFVTRISQDGSSIIGSTFLGGTGTDYLTDLQIDSRNNICLTGGTSSTNFPTTVDAIDRTFNGPWGYPDGNADAIFAKFNDSLTILKYSTFFGGLDTEWPASLDINLNDDIFICGSTGSKDFPVTPGAWSETSDGGIGDGFIIKLSNTGSSILYGTYITGNSLDHCHSIQVDRKNRAFICGSTLSLDFDQICSELTTFSSTQSKMFISVLDSSGSDITFSKKIGGSKGDGANYIQLIENPAQCFDEVILAGSTNSIDFPTTINSFQSNLSIPDGLHFQPVIMRLKPDIVPKFNLKGDKACGFSFDFLDETNECTWSGTWLPTLWDWDFGDGNISTLQNPTHTYSNPGTYNVSLNVNCSEKPAVQPVTVNSDVSVKLGHDTTICANSIINLDAGIPNASYNWSGGSILQTLAVTESGTYTLTVIDQNGCRGSDTIIIDECGAELIISNVFTPNGDGINDYWVINGLENYSENSVIVYNRYGREVYQSNPYLNNWNGFNNNNKISSGTYYYIIEVMNTRLTGSVLILKD